MKSGKAHLLGWLGVGVAFALSPAIHSTLDVQNPGETRGGTASELESTAAIFVRGERVDLATVEVLTVHHAYEQVLRPGFGYRLADLRAAGHPALLTALSVFEAMASLDYERWLDTAEPVLQAQIRGSDTREYEELGVMRSKEARIAAWREAFDGSDVVLTRVLHSGEFTVLAFEVRRPDARGVVDAPGLTEGFGDDGVWRARMVLSSREGVWERTNRYSSHPLVLLWHTAEKGLKTVGTALPLVSQETEEDR